MVTLNDRGACSDDEISLILRIMRPPLLLLFCIASMAASCICINLCSHAGYPTPPKHHHPAHHCPSHFELILHWPDKKKELTSKGASDGAKWSHTGLGGASVPGWCHLGRLQAWIFRPWQGLHGWPWLCSPGTRFLEDEIVTFAGNNWCRRNILVLAFFK